MGVGRTNALLRGLTKTIMMLLPLVLLLVFIVSKLVSPESPDTSLKAQYPDLCTRTPAELVTAAVGTSTYLSRDFDRDGAACEWSVTVDDKIWDLTVTAKRVYVAHDETAAEAVEDDYRELVDSSTSRFDHPNPEPAPGFGDEAIWCGAVDDGSGVGVLVIRSGGSVVDVRLSAPDRPIGTVRSSVEDVSRAILPLLPTD